MKRLGVALIVFLLTIGAATGAMAAAGQSLVGKTVQRVLPVVLDGKTLAKQAIVVDGTSYLPVRAVADALNISVSLENNTIVLKNTNAPAADRSGGPRGGPMDDIAGILGMTAEELQTALKAGKTLEQAAADKGMTLAQLKEKLLAETKARLDEEVAQGKMTAEQARSILAGLQNMDLGKLDAGPERGEGAPPEPPAS